MQSGRMPIAQRAPCLSVSGPQCSGGGQQRAGQGQAAYLPHRLLAYQAAAVKASECYLLEQGPAAPGPGPVGESKSADCRIANQRYSIVCRVDHIDEFKVALINRPTH